MYRSIYDDLNLLFPKPHNYDKISNNGLIEKLSCVDDNDTIIVHVIPNKNKNCNKYKYIDSSTPIRKNKYGFIDDCYINNNSDGYKLCKVKLSNIDILTLVIPSRHGQLNY